MAKVLLVRPPLGAQEILAPGTESASTFSPPFGLAHIASYLRGQGHECAIVDGLVDPISICDIALKARQYDVVGTTILSTYAACAFEMIRAIKEQHPQCPIVAGGAHVTSLPKSVLDAGADFAVLGEGEATMAELVESLSSSGKAIDAIPGLALLKKGEYTQTGIRPLIEPLDMLPMPARDLLNMDRYHDSVLRSRGKRSHGIMTSRGCPGTCTFCHKKTFGTKVRYFSVQRIVEEFVLLQDQYGAQHVSIYDDNFLTQHEIVESVCDQLAGSFRGTWSTAARVDAVNMDILKKIKDAGCTIVEYGIESGSQRILDRINKRVSLDQIRDTVKLTRRLGLATRGFFMLGFPTETPKEMDETIRFAIELNMDLASFTLVTPLPGTTEYRRALDSGHFRDPEYYLHEIVSDFAFPENPLYVPEGMTSSQLLAIHTSAYRRFYLRPGKLIREIPSLVRPARFVAMAKGAYSLLLRKRRPR